jgi:hypothetical protein
MAHGLMLVLFGEECQNPLYRDPDKTYQFGTIL